MWVIEIIWFGFFAGIGWLIGGSQGAFWGVLIGWLGPGAVAYLCDKYDERKNKHN